MRDLASPLTGILSPFGRQGGWNPRALFRASDLGFWYDPSDITTMFSDTSGITQVVDGDPIARINDKTTNGLDATQAIVSWRPLYVVASNGDKLIQNDEIDDALTVTLPDMGTAATVAYVTQSEVFFYDSQTIGVGAYTLPATDILGMVMIDRALTTIEKIRLIAHLASKAQGVNYGAALSAIQTACLNAVDVFVYDTSKDSDGGLWRTGALAQASSWYNETLNTSTRGSRREFPAVALIVAESGKVTIYDGDDSALPMWMVFEPFEGTNAAQVIFRAGSSGAHKSIAAINGVLTAGMTQTANYAGGLRYVRFIADDAYYHDESSGALDGRFNGNIARRNEPLGFSKVSNFPLIVNRRCNDVAMTVLPGAPIDPATGLPVPTMYIGTAGGVSIIDDAGQVYDSAKTTSCTDVTLDQDGKLRASFSDGVSVVYDQTAITADGFTGTNLTTTASPYLMGTATSSAYNALGSSSGLTLLMANNAGSCRIGHNYNTGWMPGDIKGAFLSDTNTTDLVATNTIADRSVNALALTLTGSCAVQSVATGAELVSFIFSSAETATLGSDISTTGAVIWWEKVSGVWQLNMKDLSGGTDYVNGASGTVSTGLSVSGATLTFSSSKEMALARATATIQTADQIAQIYADELPLFQENAACTLYGTSDAVTALAHDPDTSLLHVGTSSGRSVFDGLERKSNTTTSVATAISAAGGLVASK